MNEKIMNEVLRIVSDQCKNTDCAFCAFCECINEPCRFKLLTGQEPCDWEIKDNE